MVENEQTYLAETPSGEKTAIPVRVHDETDIYLQLKTLEQHKDYYENNGYVVFRNLIPMEMCDQARRAFDEQVKPYPGFIYRQASANPEKHRLTQSGFVENSILNIQDLNSSLFDKFKTAGVNVLTHPRLQEAVKVIFGEDGKLVQSMFFEGNPATWAHQDTYYLDSEKIGTMLGAWIAVEDIQPGAGRFYVYPGSHQIDIKKNGGDFDIAFNHERYKQLILKIIADQKLVLAAPALRKGDVFFWGAKTIHGSLKTTQPEYSRSSFTAHFIPVSHRFLQYQSIVKPLKLATINGLQMNQPKNQDVFKNRMIFKAETTFPKTFRFMKKTAIKLLLK